MLDIALLLGFSQLALAKVQEYNWKIDWVTACPDGYCRPVIGINGKWPCPQVDVDLGDRLIVNIYNNLRNQSTSLHWHGLHQNGTSEMDGASGVSQCPVAPGQSFTYDFTVNQIGTYWYHSHDMGQYPDGLWGPFIVHDPKPPFAFDEEITFTLSDWYHEQMPNLIYAYQSHQGEAPDGTPTPSGGALMNSQKTPKIYVKPNKIYYVHIICPGSYPGHAWYFDGHPMTTVEVDGVYVEPQSVNSDSQLTRIAPGQRYGVLIHTKPDISKNYAIFDTMDVNMLFINKGIFPPPSNYNPNVTGWIVYNDNKPLPPPPVFHKLDNSVFFDDLDYKPTDSEPPLGPVDHQIILDTRASNISGISRFTINDHTYIGAKVPSLYTALTVGPQYASNPTVYGDVNPFVIKHNSIVEIIINNLNSNLHPWHLHGHQFQVLERTAPNTGRFQRYNESSWSKNPLRRDTVMLQDNAYAVVRFRADNPGVWLLHCHIEFHTVSGFVATIVEAPEALSAKPYGGLDLVPRHHLEVCERYPMKVAGNAAGNTRNPLDLTGEITQVDVNDHGAMYTTSPAPTLSHHYSKGDSLSKDSGAGHRRKKSSGRHLV